jgi:Fur family peroxide stress response transcriptional regulator
MSRADRSAAKVEELERSCRQHGLPMTVQRREVLHALAPRSDHPTADQVFDDVRKRLPEISRATVYRVLETLVRIGIARKVCHPGSAARYEVERRRHHHLVCVRCEKMLDLEDASLDRLPFPDVGAGFHIQDYSVQFHGLCTVCARKQGGRKTRRGPHGRARK